MRILIDDALASKGKRSGIGSFAYNLFYHLAEIAECDFTNFSILHFIPRYFKKWAYLGVSNIPYLTRGYDIVHHIGHYSPWITGRSLHIMTVHDLGELKYPENISLAWRYYNRHLFRESVRRAAAVITVSKAIRDELLETFSSLNQDNIFSCPAGIRKEFFDGKPSATELDGLSLEPFSYFLFVGELTRRKNLKFLLQCFIAAKKEMLIDKSTQLILVGKRAWGYREISPLILNDIGIREAGYLTDMQVSALYKFCKGFIFPSMYEGFGMPIVEAMIHNAPIIISNIGASEELNQNHGNQMFSFTLGSERELIEKICLVDKHWKVIRSKLSYGNLSQYSYDNIARKHLEIYELILKKK